MGHGPEGTQGLMGAPAKPPDPLLGPLGATVVRQRQALVEAPYCLFKNLGSQVM